ncbi:hypothetical protein [Pelagibacterium montanilacus]|uniref:hypothetical protein n=1 Tax=Pelagibacterium montanilacus TaxID=2185280 RepID=UPI000F8F251F|nr:hypothetical protein [Pelagibacterium montanilacus]
MAVSKIAAGAAALVLGLTGVGAVQAQTLDPRGVWEPANKESRYQFEFCGEDGQSLCARLIWIQEDKKDARNVKYLDTYMFSDARQTRAGFWRGTVTLEGFRISGTVEQTSPDRMDLQACALLVICEDIRLSRVSE